MQIKMIIYYILHAIFSFFYGLLFILLSLITIFLYPFFRLLRFNKHRLRYFSHVYWKWIKQRPHFTALFLANNGYNVTYSMILDKQNTIDKKEWQCVTNENHNIIFKDLYYNSKSRVFRKIYFLFISFFMNNDVIIFTYPTLLRDLNVHLLRLKGTKIIYDCMDYYEGIIPKQDLMSYKKVEKRLVTHSHLVTVSSLKLKKDLVTQYHPKKILLIRNGYDKDTYSNYDRTKFNFKKPNAVYIGIVETYFDFANIIKYAIDNPNFHFYIIGPIVSKMQHFIEDNKQKNIHFLGPVEHERVPEAIKESDLLLIPFNITSIIERIDPVKIYEYLFFKKNIVSTYWDELGHFKGIVNFYHTYSEFKKGIEKSLANRVNNHEKIDGIIKNADWNERLKPLLKAIKK